MDELLVGANLIGVKLLGKGAVSQLRAILPQPVLPDLAVTHVKQDRPVVGRFGPLDIAHIETDLRRRGFIRGKSQRRGGSQQQQAQGDENGLHGGTLSLVCCTREPRQKHRYSAGIPKDGSGSNSIPCARIIPADSWLIRLEMYDSPKLPARIRLFREGASHPREDS